MTATDWTAPADWAVGLALELATRSPCRSKRGAVTYFLAPATVGSVIVGAKLEIVGTGYNGPPAPFGCPGRARCAGNCGQRSVHAEVRALRTPPPYGVTVDLVHVERAADGGVVACDGPSCWQCAREIVDVGFVDGVWLFEARRCTCGYGDRVGPHAMHCRIRPIDDRGEWDPGPHWLRYTAEEFYWVTLDRCGVPL